MKFRFSPTKDKEGGAGEQKSTPSLTSSLVGKSPLKKDQLMMVNDSEKLKK